MTESERRAVRKRGRKRNEHPLTLGRFGNVIPISIEAAL